MVVLQDVAAAVVKLSTRCDALEASNKNEELFAMLKRIESEVAKISAIHSTCSGHHMVPTQSSPTGECIRCIFNFIMLIIIKMQQRIYT